jgi:predicted metal-dependent hydrolase
MASTVFSVGMNVLGNKGAPLLPKGQTFTVRAVIDVRDACDCPKLLGVHQGWCISRSLHEVGHHQLVTLDFEPEPGKPLRLSGAWLTPVST